MRPEEMGAVKFSPDGRRFASTVDRQGRIVLAVVDYATNKGRTFSGDRGLDVDSFRWLTNDLIVINTTRLGVRLFDLSANDFLPAYVSVEGKSRLSTWTTANALQRVPGSATDIIVARGPLRQSGTQSLEVVDSTTGEIKRTLTGNPPGPSIREWVLDRSLVPRAATGYNIRTRKNEVWGRDSADSAWTLLTAFDPRTERGFYPVAIDADNNLLVLSNEATGRFALHKLDRSTGRPGEMLVGHPQFDIDANDLIFGVDSLAPLGVTVSAEKQQTLWFDKEREAMQRVIDASLPAGSVNSLRFLPGGRALVHSRSDVEPGAYYLYESQSKQLVEWTRSRPWIRPEQMSRSEILRYRARDGQDLFGYFTAPAKAPLERLPLLVWVHGGPSSRDVWGFDPMVQYLASRGYAVFQPNFRGSTGLGDVFETSGFKQWGRRMQDDVTDGVQFLITQGRVDPGRICIGGASYGGYAALMGLIREPQLFRCAIDEAGPTDLIALVESPQAIYNRRTFTYLDQEVEASLKQRVGDPDDPQERKSMEANSPRRLAAKIRAPVLLIYGTDDGLVPLEHGTAMRDALQAVGAPHEWKSYAGEGHGVWDRKNAVDLLVRTERFLAKHIGAPRQP